MAAVSTATVPIIGYRRQSIGHSTSPDIPAVDLLVLIT
jgi:hypothetical protein